MTLPAVVRGLGAPPPTPAPLVATVVSAPPAGSAYWRVRLAGDPVARTLARLVDGAGFVPTPGTKVRLELVGRDLTIVRGA